jgi:putative component of toxin-antitoxin plasmid stabilization module
MSEIETGQGYRPYNLFHGSVVPYSLAAREDISPGAKLTFGELAALMGKAGYCKPSVEHLAGRLGASVDQVTRWLRELTEKRLIRSKRCGPGTHAERVFLWDDCLEKSLKGPIPETAKIPVQEDDLKPQKSRFKDSAETAKTRVLKPDICGSETGNFPVVYKEEEVLLRGSIEEVSSSSVLAIPASDDEPIFSENEKPNPEDREALIEHAQDTLRGSIASIRAKSEGITQTAALKTTHTPDKEITVDILNAFQSFDDFQIWIDDTENRALALKARNPSAVYALYRTDAKMRAEDIAADRVKAEKRRAKEEIEAEQERAAEAAEVKLLDTPMPALRAFGLVQPRLDGRRVPGPLKATLERTGELISPNALEHAIRGWKRCANCDDSGTVGTAFHQTLAFCACAAGIEAGYDKGADWPTEEIARVHANVKNKLVAAARTISVYFGDAIEASSITETPSELVFDTPKGYRLYFRDKGFSEVLEIAGEQRTVRLVAA